MAVVLAQVPVPCSGVDRPVFSMTADLLPERRRLLHADDGSEMSGVAGMAPKEEAFKSLASGFF